MKEACLTLTIIQLRTAYAPLPPAKRSSKDGDPKKQGLKEAYTSEIFILVRFGETTGNE